MCLIDKKRFRFTFKPIKVYKVVAIDRKTNEILSPFKFTPLHKFNFTLSGSPKKLKMRCPGNKYYEFNGGFFHSCKNMTTAHAVLQDAELIYMCSHITSFIYPPVYSQKYDFTIITGWVPPFTRYAIGKSDRDYICSRCLILRI